MPKNLKLDGVDQYISTGMPKVEGWLNRYAAELIAAISASQQQVGIRGAVGEIGVHHGKLFILLLLGAGPEERAFAIDLFEDQDQNTDDSGKGDRTRFVQNVRAFSGRDQDVLVISKSSLEVSPGEIVNELGPARLISIDAGHTAECTNNDLKLAAAVMDEGGVAILDDYFNAAWPDVATGAAEYFLDSTSVLRPFAIGPNKLFLSAPSNHDFYRKALRDRFDPYKTSRMFRAEVDLYGADFSVMTPGNFIRLGIRESALGPYAVATNTFLQKARSLLRLNIGSR
jgi:hypothetical protein